MRGSASNYITMQQLFPYQQEAVQILFERQRSILADDTGLGKTIEAIALAQHIEAQRVLVIARAGLKRNWAREVGKWYPIAPVQILDDSLYSRLDQIKEFDRGFLIGDHESVRWFSQEERQGLERKKRFVSPDLVTALSRISWDLIIVDEAHWFANRKSHQSTGLRKLVRRSPYLLLLTATYIRNRASDVWHLLHLCNPKEFSSFWHFAGDHLGARQGKYGWEVLPRPVDDAAFASVLRPYVLQRTKEQVRQDAPPVTMQQLWVELHGEQRRIYQEMEAEMVAQISLEEDDLLIAPICLAQITRLRQICAAPSIFRVKEPGAKFELVKIYLEDTDQRVVIFSQFVEALLELAKYLKLDTEWQLLAGQKYMSAEHQDAVVQNFQSPSGPQVLLAGMQAGGEGHTLTAASIGILLDKHYTPAVQKQVIGRLDREGQTKPVTIVEVLAESSVERWIEDLLQAKQDLITGIVQRVRQKLGVKEQQGLES